MRGKLSPGDYVLTPGGAGQLYRIAEDKVIVEMDYLYLVEFPLESIKLYLEGMKMEKFSDRLELMKDFLNLLSQRIKEYEEGQENLSQQVNSETEIYLSIMKDFLNLLSQKIKEYEENQEIFRQEVISETEKFLSILKAEGAKK
ncbi:MAG: hypothetical protein QXM86_00135 [Candidatus Bathyarchaeia archaeon]